MFPNIEHIDQVLPVVAERSDFVVARRDGYTAIDYVYASDDTFDDPLRRECRGLKFDADGRLIARPFHKFFNLGEKPETQPHLIDLGEPHLVMDKLDGSMVHPAVVNGALVFMTRMGATDIAARALEFAPPPVHNFCLDMLAGGATPIFEWCAPDNRIVIAYPEPRLTLLAIRNNASGTYWNRGMAEAAAADWGVPIVRAADPIADLAAFVAHVRALQGAEGYVVRFDSGLTIKIKADDYVLRHKSKDQIGLEKNALAAVLRGQVDDLLPLLPEQDAAALERYAASVEREIAKAVALVERALRDGAGADRKTFATTHAVALPAELRGCAFLALDGRETVRAAVTSALAKRVGSSSDVERIRPLLGGLRWSDFYDYRPEAA